ncbi:MAG TPA: ATP-dependent Clp protease proteolytic subunit [Bdellovibrionales bacterium]|nr:ATP-dependent Clp protease proteolytic subunit [Bdellovibrionales bacterium]
MKIIGLSSALIIVIGLNTSQATTVKFKGPGDANAVTKESVAQLIANIERLKNAGERDIVVELNSGGGDLQQALNGYAKMKELGVDTYASIYCGSSCTILYAAGKRRTAGKVAKFMFHPIKIELASGLSKEKKAEVKARMDEYIHHFSQRWYEVIRSVDSHLAYELERDNVLTEGRERNFTARTLRRSGFVSE